MGLHALELETSREETEALSGGSEAVSLVYCPGRDVPWEVCSTECHSPPIMHNNARLTCNAAAC